MTARDEAIEAMATTALSPSGLRTIFADALDAIPPDVLARLAIEQGALKRYHALSSTRNTPPLYRVAEP